VDKKAVIAFCHNTMYTNAQCHNKQKLWEDIDISVVSAPNFGDLSLWDRAHG